VALKERLAYTGDNSHIEEESAAAFKQWMDANQYDPEHGKELPTKLAPAADGNPAH
jgi:hypothetical protein